MQFCNEQIKTQPLFSPPCASATYGSARMCRRKTHRIPLKLVKQSVGWNNANEQICNQCTSRLSRYLWFTYESSGIFPTSSAVARSCFLAGVTITNTSMQLALLYSELDYLTYNPTSQHGTGYTFTWLRPTVEPVWIWGRYSATH